MTKIISNQPEVILEIDPNYEDKDYEGICIRTNKRRIKFLIESGTNCCESYGYLYVQDDLNQFFNAELRDIKLVVGRQNHHGKDLQEIWIKKFKERLWYHEDETFYDDPELHVLFIDVYTSKGVFNVAVYNQHNGYYGHKVKIVSEKTLYSEEL